MTKVSKARLLCRAAALVTAVGIGISACSATDSTEAPTTSTSTTLDAGLDYTLTFSSYLPNSASLYGTYLIPWTEAVTKSADGRVTFEMTEPGGLPKDYAATLKDVLAGRLDLTVFEADWVQGEYPLLELASLPMLFPDTEVAARVTLQLIEEYGQEEYEGLHVLGFMASGLSQYGGLVPVRVPGDFAGLRIWTDSDLEKDMVTALGATPEDTRSTGGLATSIYESEIDGLFIPWIFHAANTNRWAEYWTTCDLSVYRAYLLVMNQAKWNSLPPSVQQAFTGNSGTEASAKYAADEAKYEYDNSLMPALPDKGYDYRAVEERALQVGHPIYVLSDAERAEWREALRPVWDKWLLRYASALPTSLVLDRAIELTEEYSAE